jgi:hypothetical protein
MSFIKSLIKKMGYTVQMLLEDTRTLSLEVKRPRCEADHSPPSSDEAKNAWSYTSTPHYALTAWSSVEA